MAGGQSQFELFDLSPAPKIQRSADPGLVHSRTPVRVYGFIHGESNPSCSGTTRKFARHGQSGTDVGLLPRLADVADDLAIVKWVATDVFNHPQQSFLPTPGQCSWPAQHRLLGHLRHRQRVSRPSRLRGASSQAARAAKAERSTGRGLSSVVVPGVPLTAAASRS